MSIALSGTRYDFSNDTKAAISAFLISNRSHAPFLVGDCRSGVDRYVRFFCDCIRVKYHTYLTEDPRTPASLRNRTIAMISAATVLYSFPLNERFSRSGSWLSIFAAFSGGKKCFVYLPFCKYADLPTCRGITGWAQVNFSQLNISDHNSFFWFPTGSQTKLEV